VSRVAGVDLSVQKDGVGGFGEENGGKEREEKRQD
jgi:hypothetical protein